MEPRIAPEKTTRILPVDLTPVEINRYARQLATGTKRYEGLEMEKKALMARLTAQLKELRAANEDLAHRVTTGKEDRVVDCVVIHNLQNKQIEVRRCDNWELVECKAMSSSLYASLIDRTQQDLDFEDEDTEEASAVADRPKSGPEIGTSEEPADDAGTSPEEPTHAVVYATAEPEPAKTKIEELREQDGVRRALLQRLSAFEDVLEEEIAEMDPYVRERWEHVQAVKANTPPAWDAHCQFTVTVGPDKTALRVEHFPKKYGETSHFEFFGPTEGGISNSGYRSEYKDPDPRFPTPQDYAQAFADALHIATKGGTKMLRENQRLDIKPPEPESEQVDSEQAPEADSEQVAAPVQFQPGDRVLIKNRFDADERPALVESQMNQSVYVRYEDGLEPRAEWRFSESLRLRPGEEGRLPVGARLFFAGMNNLQGGATFYCDEPSRRDRVDECEDAEKLQDALLESGLQKAVRQRIEAKLRRLEKTEVGKELATA